MSTIFELEYGAERKAVAEWGLDVEGCRFQSLAPDTLTLVATGRNVDLADLFPWGGLISVYKVVEGVSTRYFFGRVKQPGVEGGPQSESHKIEVLGPWEWLNNYIYQQEWVVNGAASIFLPRCNLFDNGLAQYVALAVQVEAILEYALDTIDGEGGDAPFQIGTITLPTCYPPFRELVCASCAEAINQCLRYAPDAIVNFDYTSTPPTIHIRSASALTPVSLALAGNAGRFSLAPYLEQRVPCVRIIYEVKGSSSYWYPEIDIYPPTATGREYGALNQVVNLKGGSTPQAENTEIIAYAIPADQSETDCDWLKLRCNWLRHGLDADAGSPHIRNLVMDNFRVWELDVEGNKVKELVRADYPRELVQGTITPLMQLPVNQGGDNIKCTRARAEIIIDYDYYNYQVGEYDDHVGTFRGGVIAVNFIATDAEDKTYRHSTGGSAGEPLPPVSMAEVLYNALNRSQYRGTIPLTTEEVGDIAIGLGNTLNLTGLRAEWATMNALIVGIDDDLRTGTRTITIGPPPQLSLSDLVELCQPARHRRPANTHARKTGDDTEGGLELWQPKWTAELNTGELIKEGARSKLVIQDTGGAAVKDNKITSDAPNGVEEVTFIEGE